MLEAWQDIRERHESAPLSGVPQAGPGRTHAMRLDEDDIIDMRPAEPEYYLCRHALEKRGIKYTIGKSRALVDPVQAAILAAAGDPRKYAGGQADGQEPDGDSEDLDESESDDDGDNDESSIDEMGEWRNQDPVASTYRIQQKRREIDQQELDEFMAAERLRRAQDPPGCGPDDDLEPESEPEREPEPAPKPVVEPRTVDIDVSDDELSLQPVAMTPRGRSPKKECATPFATPTGRREQTAGPSTTKAIRKSLETISLEESDDELEVACSSPLSKGKPRAVRLSRSQSTLVLLTFCPAFTGHRPRSQGFLNRTQGVFSHPATVLAVRNAVQSAVTDASPRVGALRHRMHTELARAALVHGSTLAATERPAHPVAAKAQHVVRGSRPAQDARAPGRSRRRSRA